jgi:hypothetical protein
VDSGGLQWILSVPSVHSEYTPRVHIEFYACRTCLVRDSERPQVILSGFKGSGFLPCVRSDCSVLQGECFLVDSEWILRFPSGL